MKYHVKYQQRHYKDLAGVVRELKAIYEDSEIRSEVIDQLEKELVSLFRADNPRFDQERFEKASEL